MTPPEPGMIDLTLQGSAFTSNAITPQVLVNGYRVPAHYGFNRIPMSPGRARVDVSCQWLLKYGKASLEFDVRSGEAVPVFYAAPFHQLSDGSIGHAPQQRRGVTGLLAVIGGFIGLVVLGVAALVVLL